MFQIKIKYSLTFSCKKYSRIHVFIGFLLLNQIGLIIPNQENNQIKKVISDKDYERIIQSKEINQIIHQGTGNIQTTDELKIQENDNNHEAHIINSQNLEPSSERERISNYQNKNKSIEAENQDINQIIQYDTTTNQDLNTIKAQKIDTQSEEYVINTEGDQPTNQMINHEKPKYIYTKNLLKSKFLFWFMVNHAGLTNLVTAYNMGLFNTLSDHMIPIYGWTEDEKTLHYSLINSLPQAVAAIISLFAGGWAARFGRRKILLLTFALSMLGNCITLITHTAALYTGRLIIGFCFGVFSAVGPLYSIEIACKQYKGYSGMVYSLYFGVGILLAFLVGYGLPNDPNESRTNDYWRFMYSFPLIICTFIIVVFLFVFRDETIPYILLQEKDDNKAKRVLNKFYVDQVANEEYSDLKGFAKHVNKSSVGWRQILGPEYRSRLLLVFMLTIGFNYIGCNAINIYSFNIIKAIKDVDTAKMITVIMPIGDIIGPFFSFYFIDRIGRKLLYLIGLTGCVICLLTFSITGWSGYFELQIYCILLYKVIFGSFIAPVHWIYPSEILPPIGVGLFSFVFWCASLSTVQFLPYLLDSQGAETTIIVFPIVTFFVIIYLSIFMKETSGKRKEEIELMFSKPSYKQSHNGSVQMITQHTIPDQNTLENEKHNKKH